MAHNDAIRCLNFRTSSLRTKVDGQFPLKEGEQ